jgi:chemotaxis methyl-accepting protein methylase
MTMFLPADARQLAQPTLEAWSELLQRRAGLAVRDTQLMAFVELLHARMKARGIATAQEYFQLLDRESDAGVEWTEVVERMVSPETSFFRHPPSYDVLRTRLLPELRRRPHVGGHKLNVLSAGCSTGQEPYSIAMVLLAEDLAGDFTVSGIDISRRSIEVARRGRYSPKAAATVPVAYRQRFLQPITQDGRADYQVARPLQERVRFTAMNLFTAADFSVNYDVIFCQNVVIYFVPAAVSTLIARLGSRLNAGGYLVPGPGEAAIPRPPGLEPVTINGVRMFRRVGRTATEVRS